MKQHFHLSSTLCCCLFIFNLALSLSAQPGTFDPVFGDNGEGKRFIKDLNLFFHGGPTVEMPDGKILIGGTASFTLGTEPFPLIGRLLPNGSTDTEFAGTGYVTVSTFTTILDITARSLIQQPDGKLLQSGRVYNDQTGTYQLFIIRYLEDGTLDETFANQGILTKLIPDYSIRSIADLVLQPDGKIVSPGAKVDDNTGEGKILFFRFLPDGSPDPTFGTDGVAELDLGYFRHGTPYIKLQPDGKIVAAGVGTNEFGVSENLVLRINSDGSLDTGFGANGFSVFYFSSTYQDVSDMELTPTGEILVAGYGEVPITGFDMAIAKLRNDGLLDDTFGDGGIQYISNDNYYDSGSSICVQPDGKILFAGNEETNNSHALIIYRLNADGTTDNGFGVNGVVVTSDNIAAPRIVMQSNGSALISGQGPSSFSSPKPSFFIARMLLDLNVGIFDSGESNMATMFYPNPVHDQALLEYELLKDQNIEATIYTCDGTQVATCLPKSHQSAGKHKEQLNIAPDLPAGNYILKITADDAVKTVRFIKI